MTSNGFEEHCREIARRFLLTAVVVDDELSASADGPVHGELARPGQGARPPRRSTPDSDPKVHRPRWPLRVDSVTRAFARQGMICGVVSPWEWPECSGLAELVARADIVILDLK